MSFNRPNTGFVHFGTLKLEVRIGKKVIKNFKHFFTFPTTALSAVTIVPVSTMAGTGLDAVDQGHLLSRSQLRPPRLRIYF